MTELMNAPTNTVFERVGLNRRWRHSSGVQVILPADKKTYRVMRANGDELPKRFRSFERAILAALNTGAA